jgi:hypothetical protein
MKTGTVILLTVALTLLAVFLLGLLGTMLSILKFVFWAAVLIALLAFVLKLLRKSSAPSTSSYSPGELESWDKTFEEYKQRTDFKTK